MEFYLITKSDLDKLDRVAKRLYSENRMNGDEMRDAAQVIDSIVRCAMSWDELGKSISF